MWRKQNKLWTCYIHGSSHTYREWGYFFQLESSDMLAYYYSFYKINLYTLNERKIKSRILFWTTSRIASNMQMR